MKYTPGIAALTALVAIGIAATAPAAPSQTRDERAIRALSDQWQRDIAVQNVDRIVALHAPDAVIMFSHAPLVTGTTAIRGGDADMGRIPGLVLHSTPTNIDVPRPT